MEKITVQAAPIEGQKPGTSGLRKKTAVFMGEHYLENFVQSVWNGIGGVAGKTLVLGGDGLHGNGTPKMFTKPVVLHMERFGARSQPRRVLGGQLAAGLVVLPDGGLDGGVTIDLKTQGLHQRLQCVAKGKETAHASAQGKGPNTQGSRRTVHGIGRLRDKG